MSDIFREVDEEVRQDRALAFWNRYQGAFLVLAAIIILATAGWRIYASRQEAQIEETGARYLSAVQLSREGKSAEAISNLESIVRDGSSGYRQLAALRLADEIAAGDAARATTEFDRLSGDTSIDPLFRDVARLRAGMLMLDAGKGTEATARLSPLAVSSGPFRSTARELLAAAAIATDDLPAAGRWLDEIVRDPSAPADVRQRAEAFLSLVRAGRRLPAK